MGVRGVLLDKNSGYTSSGYSLADRGKEAENLHGPWRMAKAVPLTKYADTHVAPRPTQTCLPDSSMKALAWCPGQMLSCSTEKGIRRSRLRNDSIFVAVAKIMVHCCVSKHVVQRLRLRPTDLISIPDTCRCLTREFGTEKILPTLPAWSGRPRLFPKLRQSSRDAVRPDISLEYESKCTQLDSSARGTMS